MWASFLVLLVMSLLFPHTCIVCKFKTLKRMLFNNTHTENANIVASLMEREITLVCWYWRLIEENVLLLRRSTPIWLHFRFNWYHTQCWSPDERMRIHLDRSLSLVMHWVSVHTNRKNKPNFLLEYQVREKFILEWLKPTWIPRMRLALVAAYQTVQLSWGPSILPVLPVRKHRAVECGFKE